MGQGGSISENKSIILSNWIETKPNSNIFYNKVTNQQIQRHEVLINHKNQLNPYIEGMQDQTSYICRLIYFHSKSNQKDKQVSGSQNNNLKVKNQCSIMRTKSMEGGQEVPNIQENHKIQSYPQVKSQTNSKVYYVYTDRMIPIKQWNKEKIVQVFQGFKKLVKTYGFFKIRENCICENQRKQVKIWINQNPISNFPVENVQSEEDMIVDLAAILVSKKQKIAKQLLDLRYFDEVIEHLTNLQNAQNKKIPESNRQTHGPSHNRQSNQEKSSNVRPQVNNFYNVFINTDNSYTVSSSLQNSKYNYVNKTPFPYPYYQSPPDNNPTTNNPEPPTSKYSKEKQELPTKRQQVIGSKYNKHKYNNSQKQCGSPTYSPYQVFSPKSPQMNYNYTTRGTLETMFEGFPPPEKEVMQNTSIMMHAGKEKKVTFEEKNVNFNAKTTGAKFMNTMSNQQIPRTKHNSHGNIKDTKPKPDSIFSKQTILNIQNKDIAWQKNSNNPKFFTDKKIQEINSKVSQKSQTHKPQPKRNIPLNEHKNSPNYDDGQKFHAGKVQYSPGSRAKSKFDKHHCTTQPSADYSQVGNRNVFSYMNTLKTNQNPSSNLNKKSFPKYFQDKNVGKSISKYYQKTLLERQKSRAPKQHSNRTNSPSKSFINTPTMNHNYGSKNAFSNAIPQHHYHQALKSPDIVLEVQDSEACSQEIINVPNSEVPGMMRFQSEIYEQRKKFPSTLGVKNKYSLNTEIAQNKGGKKKFGANIEEHESQTSSNEVTKNNFIQKPSIETTSKYLKKSNNTFFQVPQGSKNAYGNSYSSVIYDTNKTKKMNQSDKKKRSGNLRSPDKNQNDIVTQEERTLSFPYPQPRKVEKQFTFSNQKPIFGPIQQMKPYEIQKANKLVNKETSHCSKKSSFEINQSQKPQKQTADQKQKRMFKITKTSQIFQADELHKSDPGKAQQNSQKFARETTQTLINEKLSIQVLKSLPTKVKKWQPNVNIYGSLINPISHSPSTISKKHTIPLHTKQDCKSQNQHHNNQNQIQKIDISSSDGLKKLTNVRKVLHESIEENNKGDNDMSDVLEEKKKIRKELLMDYKGLFGDDSPLKRKMQQEQQAKMKEERKLQLKRQKEEEEKLLQSMSSKDLLIQEKVEKQRQKHAQLKSDLSKLFTDD